MNTDSNILPDKRGILLTDTIDFNWICSLEPQYFDDFCKFAINTETGEMVIGQSLHSSAKAFLGSDESVLYGGNIFFEDGHVEYDSTLNIDKQRGGTQGRVINDPNVIDYLNNILFQWWVA